MRVFPLFLLSVLGCLAVLTPVVAHAELEAAPTPLPPETSVAAESTPSEAPKPGPDPAKLDTVRLKDGSLYRGTLLEHDPTGHTLLLRHDGTQQSFEAAAIAEVVPAAQASSGTAPAAPVVPPLQDGSARLRVHTSPGFRLFARKSGDSGFRAICANDCETQLPAGPYEFQLRGPTGSIYETASLHDVDQSSRVDALLTSRRPARIVGGVILGGGVLTGAILLGRGLAKRGDARDACDADGEAAPSCRDQADKVGRGHIIGGVITALLSGIVGAILVSRHDQLSVSVEAEPIAAGGADEVPFEPAASADPSLRPVTSGPAFDEVQASLRARQSEIRACIAEMPATVEVRIAATGAVRSLHLYGDLEEPQRKCLRQALQTLGFAAGAERAVSIDIQPVLR